MRQIGLFISIFCVCLLVLPEAYADNDRLWIQQSQEDGGDLKTWMMRNNLADEDSFACKGLLGAAWVIADSRGVSQTVSLPEAQTEFTQFLADWFFKTNNLPCETLETRLTWAKFGENGRLNSGYIPFNAEVVAEAKAIAEAGAREALSASTETGGTEEVAPMMVNPPEVLPSLPPVNGGSHHSSAISSGPRLMPVMRNGKILSVVDVTPTPIPTQSEMEAWLDAETKRKVAEEKAEREAAEAAAREAEEAERRRSRPLIVGETMFDDEEFQRLINDLSSLSREDLENRIVVMSRKLGIQEDTFRKILAEATNERDLMAQYICSQSDIRNHEVCAGFSSEPEME